ncbi:MAG TPA: hypothetical protein VEY71_05340, partial [Chitinophagales bacterium]|nr:hypothetical protein [Chitinophagales bacterium]
YAFDSVHFHNSTIALSNFSVITTSHPLRPRNERSFAIPHFALMGMDWYQLIFDQNLRAREAVLYHPDIKYTRKLPAAASSQVSMLSSLHTLDSLLTLDRITIVNGRVNVALGNGESFSFEDVSLLVNSNRVLAASGVTELRDAVQNLSFLGGRINYANTTTVLENVKSKNGIIQAGNVLVTSSDGSVEAEISDVVIGNVTLDNKTGSAAVDGVRWTDADVKLKTASGGGNGGAIGDNTSLLTLRNVSGDNTAFALITDGAVMSTMVKTLRVASLEKNGNRPFRVEGLLVDGNALKVLDTAGLKVEATEYKLDGEASYVKGLTINRFSENDSLTVSVPHVDFYADENAILANRLHLHSLDATAPEIKYAVYATDVEQVVDSLADSLAVAPDIRVGKVMLRGPLVALTFADETNEIDVLLPADSSALIGITELRLDTGGFGAKAVSLNASSFSLASTSGENFGLDSGAINIRLTDVRASDADNKTTWNALVETLDLQKAGGMLQAAKRGTLRLDSVSLAGMRLSSANTADYPLLVRENAGMTVRTVTGSYIDSTTTLNWHNVSYAPSGELKLDSFSYRPSQPRDVVIERSQYETDYVTFRTGAVHFAGLNAGRFARDSALTVSRAFVHQPVITAYRDKAPPFLHGIVKPLPVDMVKRLPFPLHVQRLDVADGLVEYTERHEFSRATGVISLNAMRGTVLNLKNHDLRDTDSLTILLDTRLLDTIGTHVRVRQAYTDT